MERVKKHAINNVVPIMMLIIIAIMLPVSKIAPKDLVQEMIDRLSRNLFLVLSLLIPIIAGMGLNFGIILGAMGAQIALIFVTDWNILGTQGIFLAMILSVPFAALLGYIGGVVLNNAKGREMITSMILGLFINGVYQLVVLYGMGKVIPISNESILLSRGYGIRNAIDLKGIRMFLDDQWAIKLAGYRIPCLTIVIILLICAFIIWFRSTKLGQDMRAIGQDREVAKSSGIDVDRTRIVAIVLSTILAGLGQVIYLQNVGTLNTYNSHEQIGMFSIAALLVGGATVYKATISNAITGVLLFHILFLISPRAGKELIGSAQIGEFFRVFISYGVIAIALVLHQWKKDQETKAERQRNLEEQLRKKTHGGETE